MMLSERVGRRDTTAISDLNSLAEAARAEPGSVVLRVPVSFTMFSNPL